MILSGGMVLFAFASGVFASIEARIEQRGRRIQLDGILIEWDVAEARVLSAEHTILFDAIQTPEGLTGYIRFPAADTCDNWRFRFQSGEEQWELVPRTSVDQPFYAFEREADTLGNFEWILPWQKLETDTSGVFRATMKGDNGCGDSTQLVSLVGPTPAERVSETSSYGALGVQVALIIILLVGFLYLRLRARRIRRK